MFHGGKDAHLSSSAAAVLPGQEMLVAQSAPLRMTPSSNPPPTPCFFHLSPFPFANQDEAAFCSLNLRKPNVLETLLCQKDMAISVYLYEVMSPGSS